MLDLRLVRYFVAVAEAEHVGRAAERLHISQSPLSRQIQKLEEQLGLRLFNRQKQRVRLTEAGRWLLAECRTLLSRAEDLERDATRMARGELGGLRVGFVTSAMWSGLLPAALREFHQSRQEVRLELRNLSSEAQVDAIRRGELDLGLVHTTPREPELSSVRLIEEPFVLAVPKHHRLARQRAIEPKELGGEDWVILSRAAQPVVHERLLAECRKAGFVPEIRYETGDRATLLGLVEAGLGLALTPASARRVAVPGITFRELPWFTLTTRLNLVQRAAGASPAAVLFAATVTAHAKVQAVA